MKKPVVPEEIPTVHWADHAAEDLIEKHPQQDTFVCASGISPSGLVHIGNFREVITVAFVVNALKERGKKVRFIYSWDDYDAFRKVPKSLPNQELLTKHLRKPLSKVPNPYEDSDAKSYAAHFERQFEKSLEPLDITPTYIRQNEPYRRGDYAQGVLDGLRNEKKVRAILDQFRTEPLEADWSSISIFCKECDRDTTELISSDLDKGIFQYRCTACKKELSTNIHEPESGIKLLWRIDWPMRWAKEKVDFEPGGKDHSSRGGSYETGTHIIREIWKRDPPYYVQYDFVVAKGLGAKLSSSSGASGAGTLITLDEALQIYEPSALRWIFASRKPNIDFSIAFDLDVIRTYDDFDRTTRIALGTEEAEEKKANYERRVYEFSRVSTYPSSKDWNKKPFFQAAFRHLCNILQIHQGDIDKAVAFYEPLMTDKVNDEKRLRERAKRAWNWVTQFAPEDFRFQLRAADAPPRKSEFPDAMKALIKIVESPDFKSKTEEGLANEIFQVMKGHGVEPKLFFQDVYGVLIGKPNGPRLASFLLALGPDKSLAMLKKTV